MIEQAINQWNAHKEELREYLKTHEQEEYDSYAKLFKLIVKIVLNTKGDDNMYLDPEKMTVIDNGDYSGTQIFILPTTSYLPDINDYYWTNDYYGSCSGCDTLLSIIDDGGGLPSEKQVDEYMTLCLHQVQRLKKLNADE